MSSKGKAYSIVEAATILNCSAYDIKKLVMRNRLKGYKKGPSKNSPWIVYLTDEQVASHSVKPERMVTHEQSNTSAEGQAEVAQASPIQPEVPKPTGQGDSQRKRTTGLSPVSWFGQGD